MIIVGYGLAERPKLWHLLAEDDEGGEERSLCGTVRHARQGAWLDRRLNAPPANAPVCRACDEEADRLGLVVP